MSVGQDEDVELVDETAQTENEGQTGGESLKDRELRYKVYLEQRQSLIDIEVEACKSLDNWLVTLSAGAFGLSITFIEKISPQPDNSTLWMLGGAWIFLLFGMLQSLVSHLTSQSAMRRQRDILDLELEKGPCPILTKVESRNRCSKATHVLNVSSMVTFAVGIFLLGAFSLSNPPKKEAINDRKEEHRHKTYDLSRGCCCNEIGKTTTPSFKASDAKATQEVNGATNAMNKTDPANHTKTSGMIKTAGTAAPQNAKPVPPPKPSAPPPPANTTSAKQN